MAALLVGGAVGSAGCGAKAGMACREPADCSSGLICSKQTGAPSTAYGVCEPALRGLGESCVRSSECQSGLFCSRDSNGNGGDSWYGICEPTPATADQGGGTDMRLQDMGPPPDGSRDL